MGSCLDLATLEPLVSKIRSPKQVHSNIVLPDEDYHLGAACDGLITDLADLALVIRTADCVPVHVTDGQRLAMLHAGWRGTEAGILQKLTPFFAMDQVRVVIGPAISAANYEVDQDLYAAWTEKLPDLTRWLSPSPSGGSKRLFDLTGVIRYLLEEMGVPAGHINQVPVCTYASSLPSYRRQGDKAARIFNYIYRRP